MPALLLPLLIAATPLPEKAITLHDVTIREWGDQPPGSGYLMFVRKLEIITASGEARTLYRVELDPKEATPPPGSRCTVNYRHVPRMTAIFVKGRKIASMIYEGDLVDSLSCPAT